MRIFAVATNKKVCDNIYVTGFNLNVIKMIPLLMLKIIVKILSTWTTLKIIVSKIWLDMRTFRVATHKKARDNIYVTGFVVNVIKRIPCL